MSTNKSFILSNLVLEDPPILVNHLIFEPNKILALVGPSGGGKTTFVKLLCGLIPAKSGAWKSGDEDLLKLTIQERRLGVVFQGQDLFDHLTAKQNVLLAAQFRAISEPEKNADELFKNLGITNCANQKARTLSGGEKQRVALARALIGEPKVLILDEPFSALDTNTKNKCIELTKSIIQKSGVPTLLISHDLNEVSAFTNNVYEMIDGVLAQRK